MSVETILPQQEYEAQPVHEKVLGYLDERIASESVLSPTTFFMAEESLSGFADNGKPNGERVVTAPDGSVLQGAQFDSYLRLKQATDRNNLILGPDEADRATRFSEADNIGEITDPEDRAAFESYRLDNLKDEDETTAFSIYQKVAKKQLTLSDAVMAYDESLEAGMSQARARKEALQVVREAYGDNRKRGPEPTRRGSRGGQSNEVKSGKSSGDETVVVQTDSDSISVPQQEVPSPTGDETQIPYVAAQASRYTLKSEAQTRLDAKLAKLKPASYTTVHHNSLDSDQTELKDADNPEIDEIHAAEEQPVIQEDNIIEDVNAAASRGRRRATGNTVVNNHHVDPSEAVFTVSSQSAAEKSEEEVKIDHLPPVPGNNQHESDDVTKIQVLPPVPASNHSAAEKPEEEAKIITLPKVSQTVPAGNRVVASARRSSKRTTKPEEAKIDHLPPVPGNNQHESYVTSKIDVLPPVPDGSQSAADQSGESKDKIRLRDLPHYMAIRFSSIGQEKRASPDKSIQGKKAWLAAAAGLFAAGNLGWTLYKASKGMDVSATNVSDFIDYLPKSTPAPDTSPAPSGPIIPEGFGSTEVADDTITADSKNFVEANGLDPNNGALVDRISDNIVGHNNMTDRDTRTMNIGQEYGYDKEQIGQILKEAGATFPEISSADAPTGQTAGLPAGIGQEQYEAFKTEFLENQAVTAEENKAHTISIVSSAAALAVSAAVGGQVYGQRNNDRQQENYEEDVDKAEIKRKAKEEQLDELRARKVVRNRHRKGNFITANTKAA